MWLKRRAESPLSPSAWMALLRFKGPTGITSQESAGGMKEGFLGCHRPVCTLKQQTGRERDRASSLPIVQPLLFNHAIHFHALTATQCNVNDYLLCTDLYQVKNHSNLNLICLHNKWFVYTELDALPQLLKISLTNKSLVRPCLGKSEKASPPHVPSLCYYPNCTTTLLGLPAERSDVSVIQPLLNTSENLIAGPFSFSITLSKHCSTYILQVLQQEAGGDSNAGQFS